MKRPKNGSTPKQFAFAQRMMGGGGETKREVALLSGYTPSMADNVRAKIENTEGYHNAMAELAHKSNNLMLEALHQFEARGLNGFTNSELIKALNAIGNAWEKIEKQRAPNKIKTPEGNRLHGLFTRKTVTETAVIGPAAEDALPAVPEDIKDAEYSEAAKPEEIDLDF